MQNQLNVVLLISAIFTCLALGVGIAYVACNLVFAAMRIRVVKPLATGQNVASKVPSVVRAS